MSLTHKQRGFTLIELLVVIAIIGILAATVIISLNSARNKAYDSTVKSDITSLMNAMEIYKVDSTIPDDTGLTNHSVSGVSTTTPTILVGIALAEQFQSGNLPTAPAGSDYTYYSDAASNYAFNGALIADSGNYFVADNGSTSISGGIVSY